MSATLAITGHLGSMFVARLKKMAAVEHTGRLLPGYGGILDRVAHLCGVSSSCTIWWRSPADPQLKVERTDDAGAHTTDPRHKNPFAILDYRTVEPDSNLAPYSPI